MKLKEARLQQSNSLLFYHSPTPTTQLLYLSTIRPAMPKQLKLSKLKIFIQVLAKKVIKKIKSNQNLKNLLLTLRSSLYLKSKSFKRDNYPRVRKIKIKLKFGANFFLSGTSFRLFFYNWKKKKIFCQDRFHWFTIVV